MFHGVLANQVVHIYVPLETMRYYISTRDAAKQMIAVTAQLNKDSPPAHVKIIRWHTYINRSNHCHPKNISKHNLRVVTNTDTKSAQYQRVVEFEPPIKQDAYLHYRSNLIEGISDLINAMHTHTASSV